MKLFRVIQSVIVLSLLVPTIAFAGAGANVNACIYLPVKPVQPLSVTFSPGGPGTHCMDKTGKTGTVSVTNAGVTCASVGYVESKGSSTGGDTCATDTSYWQLGYAAKGTSMTGSLNSSWSLPLFGDNHAKIESASKGTVVCNTQNLCTTQSVQWDSGTSGPIYFIFSPEAP